MKALSLVLALACAPAVGCTMTDAQSDDSTLYEQDKSGGLAIDTYALQQDSDLGNYTLIAYANKEYAKLQIRDADGETIAQSEGEEVAIEKRATVSLPQLQTALNKGPLYARLSSGNRKISYRIQLTGKLTYELPAPAGVTISDLVIAPNDDSNDISLVVSTQLETADLVTASIDYSAGGVQDESLAVKASLPDPAALSSGPVSFTISFTTQQLIGILTPDPGPVDGVYIGFAKDNEALSVASIAVKLTAELIQD